MTSEVGKHARENAEFVIRDAIIGEWPIKDEKDVDRVAKKITDEIMNGPVRWAFAELVGDYDPFQD